MRTVHRLLRVEAARVPAAPDAPPASQPPTSPPCPSSACPTPAYCQPVGPATTGLGPFHVKRRAARGEPGAAVPCRHACPVPEATAFRPHHQLPRLLPLSCCFSVWATHGVKNGRVSHGTAGLLPTAALVYSDAAVHSALVYSSFPQNKLLSLSQRLCWEKENKIFKFDFLQFWASKREQSPAHFFCFCFYFFDN